LGVKPYPNPSLESFCISGFGEKITGLIFKNKGIILKIQNRVGSGSRKESHDN